MRNVKLRLVLAAAGFLMAPRSQASLVGFWNFDQTSGTTAFDSSGSGINGTLSPTGASFDPGAGIDGGGAVSLSQASDGFVDMGNNYAFSGTQSFSLQVWVNTTGPEQIVESRTYTQNQDGYAIGIDPLNQDCPNGDSTNDAVGLVGMVMRAAAWIARPPHQR